MLCTTGAHEAIVHIILVSQLAMATSQSIMIGVWLKPFQAYVVGPFAQLDSGVLSSDIGIWILHMHSLPATPDLKQHREHIFLHTHNKSEV